MYPVCLNILLASIRVGNEFDSQLVGAQIETVSDRNLIDFPANQCCCFDQAVFCFHPLR